MSSKALLLLACANAAFAYFESPESFEHPSLSVHLGSFDYSTGADDDTEVFQRAIDNVAAAGGGRVVVPADTYHLTAVHMASEVHLVFNGSSVIYPYLEGINAGSTIILFTLGGNSADKRPQAVNTSIRTVDGQTVLMMEDRSKSEKMQAFACRNVRNFMVSNFLIRDNRTIFSTVGLTWARGEENPDGSPLWPSNGTIQHITTLNAHFGYGTVQAQAADGVYFEDIHSEGGVTLRLETGWHVMNIHQTGGVRDIVANNVGSTKGIAALMIAPHATKNGVVRATNVHMDGSLFAVTFDGPLLHKFSEEEIEEYNLTGGSFTSVTVDGVDAIYSEGPIVTKFGFLPMYPEELFPLVYAEDSSSFDESFDEPRFRGPSIAPVNHNPVPLADDPTVTITNIASHGFLYRPDAIDPSYHYTGHWRDIVPLL